MDPPHLQAFCSLAVRYDCSRIHGAVGLPRDFLLWLNRAQAASARMPRVLRSFPRLAGQHAAYLVRQLQVIQAQLRTSPVMHGIIKDLKPEEMKAVAAFLQSK